MDNRLFTIGTTRPGKVRQQDIPALATAIVGYQKGMGVVDARQIRNLGFVRLHGDSFDVLVVEEDWLKILPALQSGQLSSIVKPYPRFGQVYQSGQDFGDPFHYSQVVAVLNSIFADAEAYPTQNPTQGFSPSTIAGLYAQLDASHPQAVSLFGSSVSVWKEVVHGWNAFQSFPAFRPTFVTNAQNGLPGIAFDGTQWLDFPLPVLSDWSALIVGKYQTSATNAVGGFLVAAGFEGLGSGIDCYIKQNASPATLAGPSGRLATWLYGDLAPISPYNEVAPPNTTRILFWTQASKIQGASRARIGLGSGVDFSELVAFPPYDLTQEDWDPNRQLAGNPEPLLGAIGRYSGLLAGGPTFYLEGTIFEILLYSRVLESSEYTQLVSYLVGKWGSIL